MHHHIAAAPDKDLTDHRLFFAHTGRHRHLAIGGHITPAEYYLAFGLHRPLKRTLTGHARGMLFGQKDHAHAVFARGRQGHTLAGHFFGKVGVGNLNQNARAIAHQRVSPDCAAVVEVLQNQEPLLDDAMRLLALNVGHKAYAAGVML